jgi:hypothetical protein
MLLALVLAASLAQSADHAAEEIVALGLGHATDLASTKIALDRCPTCYEFNPHPELKGAVFFAQAGAVWILERKGHHSWALGITIGGVAVSAFAVVNNSIHAVRKK